MNENGSLWQTKFPGFKIKQAQNKRKEKGTKCILELTFAAFSNDFHNQANPFTHPSPFPAAASSVSSTRSVPR